MPSQRITSCKYQQKNNDNSTITGSGKCRGGTSRKLLSLSCVRALIIKPVSSPSFEHWESNSFRACSWSTSLIRRQKVTLLKTIFCQNLVLEAWLNPEKAWLSLRQPGPTNCQPNFFYLFQTSHLYPVFAPQMGLLGFFHRDQLSKWQVDFFSFFPWLRVDLTAMFHLKEGPPATHLWIKPWWMKWRRRRNKPT